MNAKLKRPLIRQVASKSLTANSLATVKASFLETITLGPQNNSVQKVYFIQRFILVPHQKIATPLYYPVT